MAYLQVSIANDLENSGRTGPQVEIISLSVDGPADCEAALCGTVQDGKWTASDTGSWPSAGAKVGLLQLPPRITKEMKGVKTELIYFVSIAYKYKNGRSPAGLR